LPTGQERAKHAGWYVADELSRPPFAIARNLAKLIWHVPAENGVMSEQCRVRLLRNGRNQAVWIPLVRKRGLVALLKSMKPIDGGFPEIDDPVPAPAPHQHHSTL
jgi:antitoxin VapB